MSLKSNSTTGDKPCGGEKFKCKKRTQRIRLNIIDDSSENYRKNEDFSATDPLGMYTGVPENIYEKPVQDADDL